MGKKRYKKILKKIDARKFKKLQGKESEIIETSVWNLWTQYGFTKKIAAERKKRGKKVCVSDYAWTSSVKEKFYLCHKPLVKILNKNMWAKIEWELNIEPASYKE